MQRAVHSFLATLPAGASAPQLLALFGGADGGTRLQVLCLLLARHPSDALTALSSPAPGLLDRLTPLRHVSGRMSQHQLLSGRHRGATLSCANPLRGVHMLAVSNTLRWRLLTQGVLQQMVDELQVVHTGGASAEQSVIYVHDPTTVFSLT